MPFIKIKTAIFNLRTFILFIAAAADARSSSSIGAFLPLKRPTRVQSSSQRFPQGSILRSSYPSVGNDAECIVVGNRRIVIQKIQLDDNDELERMSKFCIDAFYNDDGGVEEWSLLSRKWNDIKLAAMQKAQLLDISLSAKNENRCIFVAKAVALRADNLVSDGIIIGCCEAIEDKLDMTPSSKAKITITERERRKTARPRPIIENLCVQKEYRQYGIGIALLQACEKDVQLLWPGYDELFAQVDDDNTKAYRLFCKCGYHFLFADPTCTKVVMDDALFVREPTVTKRMMRKILDNGNIL